MALLTVEQWNDWFDMWEAVLKTMKRRNVRARPLTAGEAISKAEFRKIEKVIGSKYPSDFSHIVTGFASWVDVSWDVRVASSGADLEAHERPEPPPTVPRPPRWGAGFLWDIEYLERQASKDLDDWAKDPFGQGETPKHPAWKNPLPLLGHPNGDFIAFGQERDGSRPILYFDHETNSLQKVASSFTEYIDRLTRLGCPGQEIWCLKPFLDEEEGEIWVDGFYIDDWREWVGTAKFARG